MGRKSPSPGICEYWCSVVRSCAFVRTDFRPDGWRLPSRYERSGCGRGTGPVLRPARAEGDRGPGPGSRRGRKVRALASHIEPRDYADVAADRTPGCDRAPGGMGGDTRGVVHGDLRVRNSRRRLPPFPRGLHGSWRYLLGQAEPGGGGNCLHGLAKSGGTAPPLGLGCARAARGPVCRRGCISGGGRVLR